MNSDVITRGDVELLVLWLKGESEKLEIWQSFSSQNSNFVIYSHNPTELSELEEYLAVHLEVDGLSDLEHRDQLWKIYIMCMSCPFDLTGYPSRYSTENVTLIQEDSGAITVTEWLTRKRWHLRRSSKTSTRAFVQDIYCGVRRILMRDLASIVPTGLLHAAAFQIKNKSFLVVGEKGSGKSVLSYFAMLVEKADYISGDKTVLWMEKDRVLAAGQIASVRFNLLDGTLFPDGEEHRAVVTFAAGESSDHSKNLDGKVFLTPASFVRLMKIKFQRSSYPNILIFLKKSNEQYKIEKLNLEQVIFCLRENLLEDMLVDIHESEHTKEWRKGEEAILANLARQCTSFLVSGRIPLTQLSEVLHRMIEGDVC